MDLTTALTRVRAWLAHRQRLRKAATKEPWVQDLREPWGLVAPAGRPSALLISSVSVYADCAYVAAVASPDVAAHADAGIEAWGEAVKLLAQWRLSLAQDHGCYGSPTCRQCGQLDAVDAEVARYVAWCEALPGSVVPGVEDGE